MSILNIQADHLWTFLSVEHLRTQVGHATDLLTKMQHGIGGRPPFVFDTIAFRGVSGALIATPVALALGKQMILVRKPHDDTHSHLTVEGNADAKRYIILDDFVASGGTKRAILEAVHGFAPRAEYAGILSCKYLDGGEYDRLQTPSKRDLSIATGDGDTDSYLPPPGFIDYSSTLRGN